MPAIDLIFHTSNVCSRLNVAKTCALHKLAMWFPYCGDNWKMRDHWLSFSASGNMWDAVTARLVRTKSVHIQLWREVWRIVM